MPRLPFCVLCLVLGTAALATRLPLTVRNPGGLALGTYPLTTGVPFPPGVLRPEQPLRLLDEQGRPLPLQTACTARHQDGSVKWLLLDLQVDVPAGGRTLTLQFGEQTVADPVARPLQLVEKPDCYQVDTGPLQLTFSRTRCDGFSAVQRGKETVVAPGGSGGAYFVTDRGEVFRACLDSSPRVQIESRGPLRTVITTRGWYANAAGDRKCQFITRYHLFAGQPFVRVLHTWLMTEDSRSLRFRDLGFSVPFAVGSCEFALEAGDPLRAEVSAANPAGLVQFDFDRYRLLEGPDTAGPQPLGLVSASGPRGSCALLVRDFRQLFPKELSATSSSLDLHFWPAHGRPNPTRKIEDANLQYLWFVHEGEVLDFQAPEAFYNHREGLTENEYRYLRSAANANAMGLAKSHEFLVSFRPAAAAADRTLALALSDSPTCLADPKWMCDSGVFGAMQPYSPELFPRYEQMISDNFAAEQRMQAATRDYGMFNYGDSHTSWNMSKRRWDDAYRTWRNTHHGAPRVPWLLYVRSGDSRYLQYAVRNTRHLLDLDYCHYSTPEFEALPYPRGKLKGALNDYKGIVHWHSGNRLMDYNSMTDYALWYWHLTGDRWGLEVACDWGEAVKAKFTAPFGSRSGTGTMSALIDLYTDTWDEGYRPLIEAFFTHLTTKVQNVDGHGTYSDHVLSYWPQYRGKPTPVGSFPEWENYAPWLERYWDLTHSEPARRALVAWADAYLQGYGDMSSLWGTREYMNILAYAYLVTRDPKYLGRGVWELDKALGSVYRGDDPLLQGLIQSGQVSLSGYVIQRLPAFMKALAEYGQPVAADPLLVAGSGFQLPFERTRPTIDGRATKLETVRLFVLQQQDAPFSLTFHTSHSYEQRTYRVTVVKPDGQPALTVEETYPKGAKDLAVQVPADGQTGVYKVSVAAEGSMGRVCDPVEVQPALPVAFPLPGQLFSCNQSRYYFYAPPGAPPAKVQLAGVNAAPPTVQASLPDGSNRSVSSPGAAATAEVTLKSGAAGQLWLLTFAGELATVQVAAEGVALPQVLLQGPYPPAVCEALAGARW